MRLVGFSNMKLTAELKMNLSIAYFRKNGRGK
jgi:hypothetical protein